MQTYHCTRITRTQELTKICTSVRPVADINNGFVRPESPEQIGLSYLQSSYICELIERDHGFEALLAMLHGYRDGLGTVALFEEVLATDPETFDEQFEAYLQERFGGALLALGEASESAPRTAPPSFEELEAAAEERPGHFGSQLAYGRALFDEERADEAIPVLERAKELFPNFVGAGSPYHLLARIFGEREDDARVAEELEGLIAIDENSYESRIELAAIRAKLGDSAAAAAILDEAVYVFPYEAEMQRNRASYHLAAGNIEGVVEAREVLVALNPVDRAQALFDLSQAQRDSGDRVSARRTVLSALEVAPGFEPAQRLLLELYEDPPTKTSNGPREGGGAR